MVLSINRDKWIHPELTLVNGKVTYKVKFIGEAEVNDPRGMDVVREAMQKLKFSRHIKRSEGTKPPKVDLCVNVDGIQIIDQRLKSVLHDIPLHHVSFCADDKQDKRLFSFIAKGNDGKHYCYGLDSLHEANAITLTIGQAFELAYERFLQKDKATSSKQVLEMSKRIESLEKENSTLKKKIMQLESPKESNSPVPANLATSPVKKEPQNPLPKDIFDMQPFSSSPSTLVKLPPPNEVYPPKIPPRHRSPSANGDVFTKQLLNPADTTFHEGFNKGLSFKDAEISLDAFDPLKAAKQ